MAYLGSKGWYVSQLKGMGVRKHPVGMKRLETYKTSVLRNLYMERISETKKQG